MKNISVTLNGIIKDVSIIFHENIINIPTKITQLANRIYISLSGNTFNLSLSTITVALNKLIKVYHSFNIASTLSVFLQKYIQVKHDNTLLSSLGVLFNKLIKPTQNNIILSSNATAYVVTYILLSDYDDLSLSDMDDSTLDSLDWVLS